MRQGVKIVIGAVLVVLLLLAALLIFMVVKQGGEVKQLPFGTIDISQVADGIYHGSAKTTLVAAGVEVVAKDGALQSIRITHHQNGLGKAAESITDMMVHKNTLDVDAVSGATVSSKVIQSAVYQALMK